MKRLSVSFFLWIFVLGVVAQIPRPTTVVVPNSIEIAMKRLLKDADLQNASFGFYVIDLKTKEVLAEHDPNLSLVPASTQKLVTTATALEILGANRRFKTLLQYDGQLDTSYVSTTIVDSTGTKEVNDTVIVLRGNIYIKGGGDPALGSSITHKSGTEAAFLEKWVASIKAMGIDSIKGRVIGDAQIFSTEMIPTTWIWGDMGNYYGAGPCGLTVYDNMCRVEFASGSNAGDSTQIVCVKPYMPELRFSNHVVASNTNKDNAYIYGAPYTDLRYVKGSIPKRKESFEVRGTIADPAYLIAFELEHALFQNGINIAQPASTIRRLMLEGPVEKQERTTISSTRSPSVSQIVYHTNMRSVNLFAEHLLNHIGIARYKSGSTISGTNAVLKFWEEKGLDVRGMYVNDGSGLSRFDAITAKQQVGILQYMTTSKNYATFNKSLPVAGKTGTLKSVCRKTSAQGNLRAKSGYMSRVRSYAGYVTTKSKRKLAFSMILNNYNCTPTEAKKKLEKLMVAMADYAK